MKSLFIPLDSLVGESKVQLTHCITLLLVASSYVFLSCILSPMMAAGTLSLMSLLCYNLILTLIWVGIFKFAGKAYRQFLFSTQSQVNK